MDIKYNHKLVEKDKNKKWINKKYFSTHDNSKKPFSIILPPPNVTGKLHLGHAWDGYIQDTIIRFKKLSGYDVMFVPGMDHAGIATQAKVEQRLIENGTSKHKLGRDKFIEQAYEWKKEYAQHIHEQWNKLGLALDYPNERFTLDKDSNDAVNKVFIDLYNKGLIYRGVRPINWDPKLKTAISNIEIKSIETNSKMYYVRLEGFDENQVIILPQAFELGTLGYTSSRKQISAKPASQREISYSGVIMTKHTAGTPMKEYFERFKISVPKIEKERTGYGFEMPVNFEYINELDEKYSTDFSFSVPECMADDYIL